MVLRTNDPSHDLSTFIQSQHLPTFKVLCINTSASLGCFHKHICTQWLAQLAVQLSGWKVLVFTPQAQRALDRREEEDVFRPGVGNPGG